MYAHLVIFKAGVIEVAVTRGRFSASIMLSLLVWWVNRSVNPENPCLRH